MAYALTVKFSSPIAFTCMVCQNFPLPNISHVWYLQNIYPRHCVTDQLVLLPICMLMHAWNFIPKYSEFLKFCVSSKISCLIIHINYFMIANFIDNINFLFFAHCYIRIIMLIVIIVCWSSLLYVDRMLIVITICWSYVDRHYHMSIVITIFWLLQYMM